MQLLALDTARQMLHDLRTQRSCPFLSSNPAVKPELIPEAVSMGKSLWPRTNRGPNVPPIVAPSEPNLWYALPEVPLNILTGPTHQANRCASAQI